MPSRTNILLAIMSKLLIRRRRPFSCDLVRTMGLRWPCFDTPFRHTGPSIRAATVTAGGVFPSGIRGLFGLVRVGTNPLARRDPDSAGGCGSQRMDLRACSTIGVGLGDQGAARGAEPNRPPCLDRKTLPESELQQPWVLSSRGLPDLTVSKSPR